MCGLSFLRHNRLYHSRLFSLCWKRNWDRYCQPLATHEWATKGCPYRWSRKRMSVCVCPSKSDRHIRTHFFVGLRLVHAFILYPLYFSFCWKRNWDRYSQPLAAHGWATKGCLHRRSLRRISVCVCPNESDRHIRAYFFLWVFGLFTLSGESPKVTLFVFSCSSAFWRCSIQSASCYAYLHFATSRRRIRWSFSFGCKGNSGICRKSKVKPPVLREKSPALRVVFFPKILQKSTE